MRIVVAAEPIDNGAGLATFILDAVSAMAQARPGWSFTVLALSWFSDAASLERFANVRVVFCDKQGLRKKLTAMLPRFKGRERLLALLARLAPTAALRRLLGNLVEIWKAQPPYDVLWVPHFAISQSVWPALYRSGLVRAPVLLTIHDLHPAVFPDEWRQYPRMLDNFWNTFKPYARRAGSIITHSTYQQRSITEHFGIPPERIKVVHIPLPVSESLTREYPTAVVDATMRELGVTQPFVFSPNSQTRYHKNHLGLIAAWALVRNELKEGTPPLVFTARGNSEEQERFDGSINELGLQDLIVFTGTITREQVGMLYQRCRAVVSPTLYEGGGSGPAMEAMAIGKPVACSNIQQVTEQHEFFGALGKGCSYFDPHDPADMAHVIVQMLRQPPTAGKGIGQDLTARYGPLRRKFAEAYATELERVATMKGH